MSIYAYYLEYCRKKNIYSFFANRNLAFVLAMYLLILGLGDMIYLIHLKTKYASVEHMLLHVETLPLVVRIFAVHFWWIYVAMALLMLVCAIKPLSLVDAKNYDVGVPLIKIKIKRLSLRYVCNFVLGIIFAFLSFVLFILIFKLYAAGIALALGCFLIALEFVINQSIALTKEGVLIQRGFYNFFFPYDELYPLSEHSLISALKTRSFSMAFSRKGGEDFGIYLYWEDVSRIEKILNFYQRKTNKTNGCKNHPEDSNAD